MRTSPVRPPRTRYYRMGWTQPVAAVRGLEQFSLVFNQDVGRRVSDAGHVIGVCRDQRGAAGSGTNGAVPSGGRHTAMKKIMSWSYPIGVITMWFVAAVFTLSALESMSREWDTARNVAQVSQRGT